MVFDINRSSGNLVVGIEDQKMSINIIASLPANTHQPSCVIVDRYGKIFNVFDNKEVWFEGKDNTRRATKVQTNSILNDLWRLSNQARLYNCGLEDM